MSFPSGAPGTERRLLEAVRDFCIAHGLKAILDGDVTKSPKTNVVIFSAEETRPSVQTASEGVLVRWQSWRVALDVVGDELSGARRQGGAPVPSDATAVGLLELAFDESNWQERNALGLFHAKTRSGADTRTGVTCKRPFTLECDTFTETN